MCKSRMPPRSQSGIGGVLVSLSAVPEVNGAVGLCAARESAILSAFESLTVPVLAPKFERHLTGCSGGKRAFSFVSWCQSG